MRHAAPAGRARRAAVAATLFLSLAAAATACAGGEAAAERPESIDDSSPADLVEGFMAAEAAEAWDVSYGVLAAGERDAIGSVEDWRDLHAGNWPVEGGEVGAVQEDGDRATVEVAMRFRSGLDGGMGLVPARGTGRWSVVREGDRWRVAYDQLRVEPVVPDTGDAGARAVEWARAGQRCAGTRDLGGDPAVAEQLCGTQGDVTAGPVAELAGPDAERVREAVGPDAAGWARVVPLSTPAGALRAVVAPIDDRWTVVGVLAPQT
jgi:hypothetical protein